MAKSDPKKEKEIELHPDAWARFERAAGVVRKARAAPKESGKN
jgi:hypothetical protein